MDYYSENKWLRAIEWTLRALGIAIKVGLFIFVCKYAWWLLPIVLLVLLDGGNQSQGGRSQRQIHDYEYETQRIQRQREAELQAHYAAARASTRDMVDRWERNPY